MEFLKKKLHFLNIIISNTKIGIFFECAAKLIFRKGLPLFMDQ